MSCLAFMLRAAAFKYLDDSAMGVDLAVKQVVHVIHGRRRVLKWLGNPPKQRGKIGKFFFRVGMTNKWTRIVLSYRVSVAGYSRVGVVGGGSGKAS